MHQYELSSLKQHRFIGKAQMNARLSGVLHLKSQKTEVTSWGYSFHLSIGVLFQACWQLAEFISLWSSVPLSSWLSARRHVSLRSLTRGSPHTQSQQQRIFLTQNFPHWDEGKSFSGFTSMIIPTQNHLPLF